MIREAKSRWSRVVLVCGKCSRKLDGGFGADGRQSLAKVLRRRTGKGKHAGYGVIEMKCLKLCPKRAVAVVDGAHPGRWLIVGEGEPVEAVALRLDLPDQA